jgi:hypothetical protein
MKKLLSLLILAALSMGFSSCSSIFGVTSDSAGYSTEAGQLNTYSPHSGNAGRRHTAARQVKPYLYDIVTYDIVTEQVYTGDKGGKGGMFDTIEKKVPRYTQKARTPCGSCVRFYRPKKDCCGTSSDSYLKMATAQGPAGSPHIGLVPTMKKLAE